MQNDIVDMGHFRTDSEPFDEFRDRVLRAAGDDLDATIAEVDGVTGETQAERFPPG